MINFFKKSRYIRFFLALTLTAAAVFYSGFHDLVTSVTSISVLLFAKVIILFVANLFVVTLRYQIILNQFNVFLGFIKTFRVILAGQVASLFVVSIIGQILGRQLMLKRYRISPELNTSIVILERLLFLFMGGGIAFFGAIHLFGKNALFEVLDLFPFVEIAIIFIIMAVSIKFFFEDKKTNTGFKSLNINRLLYLGSWISATTLISQILVLGSFVVSIKYFASDTPIFSALAAASLISFIAAMPVTINGWGVREVAAISILHYLDIRASDAITISILIGVSATLVVLMSSLILTKSRSSKINILNSNENINRNFHQKTTGSLAFEKNIRWSLAILSIFFVWFQIHVEFKNWVINVNLADPFALICLCLVFLDVVFGRKWPKWRIEKFNLVLILVSCMILIGFIVGVLDFGLTNWALYNRLFGWLVIIGYISAGILLVQSLNRKGLRLLIEVSSLIAFLLVLTQLIKYQLVFFGYDLDFDTAEFSSFSANRNAFAFQLLIVLSLLLAYLPFVQRSMFLLGSCKKNLLSIVFPAFVSFGIWYTYSMAGQLTMCCLVGLALYNKALSLSSFTKILTISVLIFSLVQYVPFLFEYYFSGNEFSVLMNPSYSAIHSNHERFQTWYHALELWIDNPVLGAGLGAFAQNSIVWFGKFVVVHNSFLWIAAEFGLLGISIIGYAFFKTVHFSKKAFFKAYSVSHTAILFILISFLLFSLFHDVFYARFMWLVLGVSLATPKALAVNK